MAASGENLHTRYRDSRGWDGSEGLTLEIQPLLRRMKRVWKGHQEMATSCHHSTPTHVAYFQNTVKVDKIHKSKMATVNWITWIPKRDRDNLPPPPPSPCILRVTVNPIP